MIDSSKMNHSDMDLTIASRTSLHGSLRERSIPQMQVPATDSPLTTASIPSFGVPPLPQISHSASALDRTHLAPLADFPSLDMLGKVGGHVDHDFLRSNSISCLNDAVMPMYDALNTPNSHLQNPVPSRSPNSNRPYANKMQYSRSSEHLPVLMENQPNPHQPHRRGSAMLKATSFASLHRQQSPNLPYRKPSFLPNQSMDQMNIASESSLNLNEHKSPSLSASHDYFSGGMAGEHRRSMTPHRQSSVTSNPSQFGAIPQRYSSSTTSLHNNHTRKPPRTRNSSGSSTGSKRMTMSPNRRLADKIAEQKQKQIENDRKFAEVMGEAKEGDGDEENEEMEKENDDDTSGESNRRNSGGNGTRLSVPGAPYQRSLSHPNLKLDKEDRTDTPSPTEKRGSDRSIHSSTSELWAGMKDMGMEDSAENAFTATTGFAASPHEFAAPSALSGQDGNHHNRNSHHNNNNNTNNNNNNSHHDNNMFQGTEHLRRTSQDNAHRRMAEMQFGAIPQHHKNKSGARVDRFPSEPSDRVMNRLPPVGSNLDPATTLSQRNLNAMAHNPPQAIPNLGGASPAASPASSKSLFEQFLDDKTNRRGNSIHSMGPNMGQSQRPPALSPAGGSLNSIQSMGSMSLSGFSGAGTNSAPIHPNDSSHSSLSSLGMSSGSMQLPNLPVLNDNGFARPPSNLNMPANNLSSLDVPNFPRPYQDPTVNRDLGYN